MEDEELNRLADWLMEQDWPFTGKQIKALQALLTRHSKLARIEELKQLKAVFGQNTFVSDYADKRLKELKARKDASKGVE